MAERAQSSSPSSEAERALAPELGVAILDAIALPIFVRDRAHRFVLVNRAFEALAGRERGTLLGQDGWAWPDAEEDLLRALEADVLGGAGERTFELGAPPGPGHGLRRLRVAVSALGQPSAPAYAISVVTEIPVDASDGARTEVPPPEVSTAERAAELDKAQEQLLRRERLAVLGQLAGGLAHQIRNPLAAMQTAASILRRRLEGSGDDEIAQAIAVIREEVWEANRIITDLIEYARVKPPARADVDVQSLVEGMLADVVFPDSIRVAIDLEPELRIRVDVRQTRDALGNVTRNAIEAMPSGGVVTLRAHAEGEDVVIAIEDTGPGLTRDTIAHLFEPLVTSKPLGLGLGLATARALVENQGGSVRVATSPGRGAVFEIRLPRAST